MAKRSALRAAEPSKFDAKTLQALAKDLQGGRLPLERVTVSDDMVTGLRAVVYKSGLISFAISYHFDGERPFLKLGSLDEKADDHVTITEVRELAKTVKALADKGIDPQRGLHQRLIRELREKGTAWRPK